MKILNVENSKGTIFVLTGESRYEVLTTAAEQVSEGFCCRDYNVVILDINAQDDFSYFENHLQDNDLAMVFSIQAVAFNTEIKGIPCNQLMKCPSVGWIFDDFLLHWGRSQHCTKDNVFLLSVDGMAPKYAGFLKNIDKHLMFMPHGGFDFGQGDVHKDIDILIPGTFEKLPEIEALSECSEDDINLAVRIIETVIDNPQLSVRQALIQIAGSLEEGIVDYILLQKYKIFEFVLGYIRIYFRNVIINSLIKSGMEIHMVGDDSSGIEYPSNVHIHGQLNIKEVVSLMDRSKVVINPIPNVYEGGFHERIFTAFKCKSILFTPYTPFLEKELGERIDFIDLNDCPGFVDNVRMAVSEYDNFTEAINDNYEFATQNHTFKKRGEQIIDLFEKIKNNF